MGAGMGAGIGAGQTDGYGKDGDMGHVAIPQGEGQGYIEPTQGGG